MGSSPSEGNNFSPSSRLTEEKAALWASLTESVLGEGRAPRQVLEGLIWKLSFAQTVLFGKFPSAPMRGLYGKLYDRTYRAALSGREISILKRWISALRGFRHMVDRPVARRPDFILYTDAALLENRIAAVLFDHQSGACLVIKLLAVAHVPKYWAAEFYRANMIYGIQMLALLACIFIICHRVAGKSINIYIDNNNAMWSLIRMNTSTLVIPHMDATFWRALQIMGIDAWIGRAGSKLNISDLHTRDSEPLSCSRRNLV